MFLLTIQLPHEERQLEITARAEPQLLTDVLRGIGMPLNTRCGHRGLCDGCLVELREGRLLLLSGELTEPLEGDSGLLLRGCQLRLPVSGAAWLHVPARSLLAHQPQVVSSFRLNVPRAHDPLWQQVRLPLAIVDTDRPLCESLPAAVAAELDCVVPICWEAALPTGEVTKTIEPGPDGCYDLIVEHRGDHRSVRASKHGDPAYGLAIDVGTTTVVVALVDLATGDVVSDASGLNAQTKLGDNVLTRINLCMTQPRLLQRMQKAMVRSTLTPLITETLNAAGIAPHQLACMVMAGNTTMLHLLLGVDPTSLGTAPFTPAFLQHQVVTAGNLSWKSPSTDSSPGSESGDSNGATTEDASEENALGITTLDPEVVIHLLPGAAAYVGADITAGILASGMAYRDDTCLLVDLGTNGEIVLRHEGQFLGCATAAGPAFEGAGLAYGMRAGSGAVGHIWLEDAHLPPRVELIGSGTPVGLCGTAYVDFVARARQVGLIGPTARFLFDPSSSDPSSSDPSSSDPSSSAGHPLLIKHERHGRAMVVVRPEEGDPLLITEADMASLLQAKAAIAAGITCLLREAGIEPPQVKTVYLAGGFGFHMHVDSLLGCGMLPGFRDEQVETVGNTALAGAYLALLDCGALSEMRKLSRQMKIVELNLALDFESIYIDQLVLP